MVLGWGKKAESNPDTDEEMSMEEILASIRKYVSTDQQTQAPVQKEQHPTLNSQSQYAPTSTRLDEDEVSPYKIGSDSGRNEGLPSLSTPQATPSDCKCRPTNHRDAKQRDNLPRYSNRCRLMYLIASHLYVS